MNINASSYIYLPQAPKFNVKYALMAVKTCG